MSFLDYIVIMMNLLYSKAMTSEQAVEMSPDVSAVFLYGVNLGFLSI